MAVGDAYVFPGFLTPVLTQLFFPKPPTTFHTCFCRGERRKYVRKKSHLNRGSNSQQLRHESDMLTTEPPGPRANALNLDKCKILSLGKGSTHYLIHHFENVPNSKKLEMTNENYLLKDF